jgi:hypothetical protein
VKIGEVGRIEPIAAAVQPYPPAQFALWLLRAKNDDLALREAMPKPMLGTARAPLRKLEGQIGFASAAVAMVTSPRGMRWSASQSTGGGASFGQCCGVMSMARGGAALGSTIM